MEPFLGQVVMFGGNFAPRGWAFCDGQLLPISQNSALFSLLGTIYGGDGRSTFALPDLRGRVPMHPGDGPGLSRYQVGQTHGQETVALSVAEMPTHTHTAQTKARLFANHTPPTGGGNSSSPNGNVLSSDGSNIYSTAPPNVEMSDECLDVMVTNTNTGGSIPHENRQPYQCVNFIIALQGIFPSRS
ncbi:tail Collar domain-containing protein (plasmid) [Fulvitalea axinellae]|uniref:Tail Collar domain-containing protein n=1 Tax=Fulvitalea axinellae TaxID=1182444 RepID=A0AAU9D0D4_9BACT|nr:tail Collar domain-containing protein [Fulvitalea axinellae]